MAEVKKENEIKKDEKIQENKIEIQQLIGTQLSVLNAMGGKMEVLDVDKSTNDQRVVKTIECINMIIGLKINDDLSYPLFVLQRGIDTTYVNIVRL